MNEEENDDGRWTHVPVRFEVLFIMTLGALVIVFLLGAIIGNLKATSSSRREHEVEAVKQGHAEYVINKDYEKEWRWLPPCSKKEEKK